MFGLANDHRKQIVFDFLYAKRGGLLRRYRLPEHLSDDALREEVNLLVEDINGLIPDETKDAELRLLLPELNAAIRRRHGAQGWPPAKVFIAATEDAIAAASKKKAASQPERSFTLDGFEVAAGRMRAGEPVGEGYLWGRLSVELIAKGLIDRETMENYRSGAFFVRQAQFGAESANRWRSEGQERHQAAKDVYLSHKNNDRPIGDVEKARLQGDLHSVATTMDPRVPHVRKAG